MRAWELVLVMSVAFAPLLFSSTAAYILGSESRFTKLGILSLILHECLALAVLAYVLSRRRGSLADLGIAFRFADAGMGFLLAIAGGMAASSCQIALQEFHSRSSLQSVQFAETDKVVFSGDVFFMGVLLIAVNPIFEELLVRGYLMRELAQFTGSSWAPAAASVVLQSSYHLYQGPANVVYLSACFTIWAIYFSQTRRLMPVIFAHFYLDALALLRST